METKEPKYPIYLDYCGTTPVALEVLDAMLPYFTSKFGNASSTQHLFGLEAEIDLNRSISQIASNLHVAAKNIVITSGATEAINLAIRGLYSKYRTNGNHIITVKTEHKAVLETCNYLENIGADVTYLDVDEKGLIDILELKDQIRDETILTAIMFANNETGVIQDVESIGKVLRQSRSFFFCDATQAVGLYDINVERIGIDLLCMSAHKMYGPKGLGALYINKGIQMEPQILGGGHQNGLRAGTVNVPGVIGFAKACEMAIRTRGTEYKRLKVLRDKFESELLSTGKVKVNGDYSQRLPHVSNLCFIGMQADHIMLSLRNKIAVSNGSACNSNIMNPSHVLTAMGLDVTESNSSIRFCFGLNTTLDDIVEVIGFLRKMIQE
jgi:cysteine desulfurase